MRIKNDHSVILIERLRILFKEVRLNLGEDGYKMLSANPYPH